jgi:hypothetical protein
MCDISEGSNVLTKEWSEWNFQQRWNNGIASTRKDSNRHFSNIEIELVLITSVGTNTGQEYYWNKDWNSGAIVKMECMIASPQKNTKLDMS